MTEPTSRFAARVDAFLTEFFRLHPLHATVAGMHAHDGEWPDLTDAGRLERIAFADRWQAELGRIADSHLDRDERVDRDLILSELDGLRFSETELRQESWDPLEWVYLLGGGIFPLLAREFAPLADRLVSVAGRLEGIAEVVAAAQVGLVGSPGRPVAVLHTDTALKNLSGVTELVDDALAEAHAAAPDDRAVAAIVPRLEAAADLARAALEGFGKHLREVVLPAADGEGRLGAALFNEKMRHTLKNDRLTPARILERAEVEYAAVRAEMVRLARGLWSTWCPGLEMPSDEGAVVRAVSDAISTEHQPAAGLLTWCRAELGRIEAFCRERDVIGLADDPLEIRWTPVFMRSFGGAMLDTPGPLDQGQKSFFAITPIPDEWSAERAESYLREDNDRMLRVLTIHEAVPGHYLQGAYANRHRSIVRGVFWSGTYAEGWAVYVTQVMMDLGYGADDPALMLIHWKFYLRAVTNAMIDVRIHAGEAFGGAMTEDEAVRLMVEGGFQEEAEARAKYDRARLSSTQLSTYFVGSMAMWQLELEVRRRLAEASGAPGGRDAVVERALAGGLGETPGFVYRRHLETVIGHGALPPSLLEPARPRRGLTLASSLEAQRRSDAQTGRGDPALRAGGGRGRRSRAGGSSSDAGPGSAVVRGWAGQPRRVGRGGSGSGRRWLRR